MHSSLLAVVYPLFLAGSIVLCRNASSAFTKDFCKMKCGTRRHTLCNQAKAHNCSYKSYHIYRSAELEDLDLRNQLIIAHNGLRQRIASRMHVADMVLSKWSKQLATMAENWALQCRPYEDDECAHTSLPMNVRTLLNMSQANQQEMFVAMNRFCFTSLYLPRELLQMAFSRWYFERDHMQAPKKINFQNQALALLSGENNFTHLAHPRIRRIGCSVARYDNAYCIFCFYAPYYRHTDGMLFAHGQPATFCPWQYPLKNLDFPNMCTRNIYLDADEVNRVADKIHVSIFLLAICLIQFCL